jgi:death on curing protein
VIVYLSPGQIRALHRAQLRRFGGAEGVRDSAALEAAVGRPAATFDGEDLYADLASKAAALMHSLVQNHPLVDGNKRVAVAAAEILLDANGYLLLATDDELEAMTLSVARGELSAEAIAVWLRQRIRLASP